MNAQGWFPTLICDFESQTHDQFKTAFYNNMSKYAHPEGLDGEHADLFFHHNPELEFFFKEITDFAKQYLVAMELDPEEWDFNLVKCWWQSLTIFLCTTTVMHIYPLCIMLMYLPNQVI